MAYDEDLADRVREALAAEYDGVVDESAMFGGLAFLINGHMTVAASTNGLLVRVPPEQTDALADEPHVIRDAMPGRQMRGWLRVTPEGVGTVDDVAPWVRIAVTFTASLPAKVKKKRSGK